MFFLKKEVKYVNEIISDHIRFQNILREVQRQLSITVTGIFNEGEKQKHKHVKKLGD